MIPVSRGRPSGTPLPRAHRHPEDAREQLRRAASITNVSSAQSPPGFGRPKDPFPIRPSRLPWKKVSNGSARMKVLGRTLSNNLRDSSGIAANTVACTNRGAQIGGNGITGLFRDHKLSDLIGFVYSRMDASAAAADLHGRLRHLGDQVQSADPLTVCIFLDGENAWEYYPGNGRDFLRQFYKRIESDQDFRALTCSEAIAAARNIPTTGGIFPASWINANFDVWIGHAEDVAAWELLWDARQIYARTVEARAQFRSGAPTETAL